MLDLIFAIKFVHLLAAAVMLGAWLCLAAFMVMAHRSGNTSVVALTARFVVRIELTVIAPAVALQPLAGFPLAAAIGLSPLNEFWIDVALALYVAVVAGWLAAVVVERRIRDVTREAVLSAAPLPVAYRGLFRAWAWLAAPILAGMLVIFALMIWQPRLD